MKTMKFSAKFGAFILCVSMVLSLCTVFAFGAEEDGVAPVQTSSVEDDLTINTADDLLVFAVAVNGGNSYAGKVVALGGDIDLTGKVWTPIGTVSAPFSGTFDGAGYTVSGISYSGSSNQHVGFFGVIAGATIQNLTVAGDLKNTSTVTDAATIGGIAGRAVSRTDASGAEVVSLVSDCINKATVTFDCAKEKQRIAGGIVGYAAAGTVVQNCRNEAVIKNNNTSKSSGASVVTGGILGLADGSAKAKVIVRNCTNDGAVFVSLTANFGTYNRIPLAFGGGIVGKMLYTDILYCNNYANIEKANSARNTLGGIAGLSNYGSTIKYCNNYGDVTANMTAGGIIGGFDDYALTAASDTVQYCVNYGDVTALVAYTYNGTSDTTVDAYAAGICGYVRFARSSGGTQRYKYILNCINEGTVQGKGAVSGFVNVMQSLNYRNVNVQNCLNVGDVVGEFTDETALYVSSGVYTRGSDKTTAANCVTMGKVILLDSREDTAVAAANAIHVAAFCSYTPKTSLIKTNYYLENNVEIASTLTATASDYGTNTATAAADFANGALVQTLSGWYQGIETPLPIYEAYIAEAKVRGASVGLADALSLTFRILNKGAMLNEELTVSCTDANGEAVTLKETSDGEYLCYTVADITAIDMDAVYTVKVQTSEGETVSTLSYSILEYAVNKYDSADAELTALLEAMMYYGNAAQANKGEATLLAAFSQATGYEASETYVQDAYGELSLHKIENAAEDVAWIDEGMVALKLDEYVRPFLQVDGVASVTVDFNGVSDIPCEETSSYFIIDCLYAPSLEDGFCIKAYDENGDLIGQITYSVATYVLNLLEDEDATDTEMTLAKALAVYMNQAKVYKLSH